MIIDRVEIENFGPYRGSHVLNLGVGDQPLVVIHGQNMTGKTTILNSVRWALYGIAKGRTGQAIPTRELINSDAFAEGDRRVAVRLTIRTSEEEGGSTYVLRRQRQAGRGTANPVADNDFEEFVDIEQDGNVLKPLAFPELVSTLLPEGISRFFLFDGELLNEYEELVREGGEREAQAVKEAIEMILGLPAARKGRDDASALKDETSRKLQREARKNRQAKEAGDKLEALGVRKAQLEGDRDAVKSATRDAQQKLRSLEQNLKRYEESREDAGLREGLRQQLDDLEQRRKSRLDERRQLVKELWRDILAPRLKQETARLDEERARREDALHRLRTAEREIHQLTASIEEGHCSHCGQMLPEENRARVRAEIADLSRTVDELTPQADHERLQELSGIIRQLRAVAPAGKEDAVRLVEKDLDEIHITRYRVEQDLKRVEERLRSIDTEELLQHGREADRLERLIGEQNAKLREIERDLEQVKSEIDHYQRIVLQNDSPVFKRLEVELRTLEALEDTFARAVDLLTDELRKEVEAHASEIFRKLTTDPTYAGLRINENYGLTILDHDGLPVPQRSAGAEQIVALSLLGAINRMATKRGPVIMDTPFGRLDRGHRANILRYVPTMADQVVLLVHDGEVDRERDLKEIQPLVDAEYRIEHPTSTSSELVPEPVLSRA